MGNVLPSPCSDGVIDRSPQRLVHSDIDVNRWLQELPSVERARPGRCPACGAAGRPAGCPLGLVGHGLRRRQVRGALTPGAPSKTHEVMVRRYKCRSCAAVIVVAPRGVVARRHFGAMAIGHAFWLFGVSHVSAREVQGRVSDWGEPGARWRTLVRWLDDVAKGGLFRGVRAWPASFSRRQQAERVARTLEALAPPSTSTSAEVRLFEGAARAA